MMSEVRVVDPMSVGMDAPSLDRITKTAEMEIGKGWYNGAVMLIARRGSVCYLAAVGQTDACTGRRARADDVFLQMSLSKCVAASAVMKFVDMGLLSYDTKIADVWPAFAANGKKNITLAQLLLHQVLLWGDVRLPKPLVDGDDDGDILKKTDVFASLRTVTCPGELYIYQPFVGYDIAARVLMEIDPLKRSYKQIVEEELFRPLGMTDSSVGRSIDDPRRVPVSICYGGAAPTVSHSNVLNTWDENAQIPAGNVYSTAEDMFRFAEMLRCGGTYNGARILSPAVIKYAMQNHTGDQIVSNNYRDYVEFGIEPYPANYSLAGGYMRGTGRHLAYSGQLSSPGSFAAVGGGSTMLMIDPERELTFIYQSQGFMDGPLHAKRLQRFADLAISAVNA